MKKFWCITFVFVLFYQCETSRSNSSNPLSLVPDNTEILIKINAAEGLENSIKNNALIHALRAYPEVSNFNELLKPLYHINKYNNLIAISKGTNNEIHLSYIVPSYDKTIGIDSISAITVDTTFIEKNINRLIYEDKTFYSALIDSTLFISNQLKLTQSAVKKQHKINKDFAVIYDTSDHEKMVSVFINHNKGNTKPIIFEDSLLNRKKFSTYTMIDSDISQNAILINGITKGLDSTQSLINIFRSTIPQENRIATILPSNIEYFKSLTFDNYDVFSQNLISHQFRDSIFDTSDQFANIVEIGEVLHDNKKAAFLRSIDPSTTFEAFDDVLSIADTFRTVTIYQVNNSFNSLKAFSPLLNKFSYNYAIAIEDLFVFSNDISFLQSVISSYQNNSVLADTNFYQNLEQNLSDEASLLIYRNSAKLKANFNSNFTDDIKLDLEAYKSSAIQYVYDTDFAHINAVFKSSKTKKTYNTVSEELNIALDANILSPPQLLKNHTNGQKDIAVQDVNNNLYLISNSGKVLWKKQLDDKIIGEIKQIDTYKNGRLQLVFNTTKQLYVLDRNGNDVKPFPIKFNDDITQPVSVFDYDKRKNYRLMITQGKSVLMYDKHGKIVNGFNYKNAANTITSQPKHFRIGRKDFIAFTHGNKMEILNRVGKTRVNVKENISFSNNEIYLYNNKFTTSNTNGELLEINQSGKVNHKNLNANSEHKIATTSKTLVVLNDNKLTIKSKTIALDFGEYTSPRIFYINDKIYVTVTDLQSKKGYLFDSQAKSIANFPIYANSEIELANIDKDNALEVITKGDNDAIIVYEIH